MTRNGVLLTILAIMAGACSDAKDGRAALSTDRVRLDVAHQDPRCREPVMLTETYPFNFNGGGAIANADMAKRIGTLHIEANIALHPRFPIRTSLRNGVWHVEEVPPPGTAGGSTHVFMCQSNGKILSIGAEQ
jgi:hypothetical protein